jgi:hypothetical protein
MKSTRLWLVVGCSALVSGCIPVNVEVLHARDGQVVDAITHRPLQGVTVSVWSDWKRPEAQRQATVTNADGRFFLRPVKLRMWCPPAPCDPALAVGHFSFEAPGYQSRSIPMNAPLPRPIELMPAP